jgi:hypothetical protein
MAWKGDWRWLRGSGRPSALYVAAKRPDNTSQLRSLRMRRTPALGDRVAIALFQFFQSTLSSFSVVLNISEISLKR